MQCVDFFLIRLFFHASRIHNKKLSTYCSVRCERLGNFKKFQKFQTKHFVSLLPCRRSKVNALNLNKKILNLLQRKWEWSSLKWIPLCPKYLQSSLNYNFNLVKSQSAVLNQLTYLFLQHLLLHLQIEMLQIISLNVSSLCETSLNPSLDLSLGCEKVSFSNSVT